MHPMQNISEPGSVLPSRDPFAVALGNASLLGAGYVMLGLWRRAVLAVVITCIGLVTMVVTDGAGWWFQGALLLWWMALIAHGWLLARRRRRSVPRTPEATVASPTPSTTHEDPEASPGPHLPAGAPTGEPAGRPSTVRGQRLLAMAITGPVLLSFGLLRVDASRIEQAADEAHAAGHCARALSRIDSLWFGHRLADAPLIDRVEAAEPACELLRRARNHSDRLRAGALLKKYAAHPESRWDGTADLRADLLLAEAGDDLDTALRTGDANDMDAGVNHLTTVLDEIPGRSKDADAVLGEFLDGLPTNDACDTAQLTGRLDNRLSRGDDLDRALAVVAKVEPKAMVDCGDDLLARDTPQQARDRYRQLLAKYPEHKQKKRAEKGVTKATHAIQLTHVRQLLQTTYGAGKPEYCGNPAPYGGAEPYKGDGPHPTLIYGPDTKKGKLPSSWMAKGPEEAVLVICTGKVEHGTVVETCPYGSELAISGITYVDFTKRKMPVTVYEMRTGKVVANTAIQIGGESCPPSIEYWIYNNMDTGPPSTKYVTSSSASDVREAYEDLIEP